ncbi:hypothetical protein J437_LFUL019163 [Ladona fulva]|uniref:Reverse transcriptase n=1 Tax=Ladona fulva TaxID=123851 RepID=A0A8K0JU10_LADFU|nr:hypothetical protein J437_LFUL019163 [Ladona fulva]
MGNSMKGRWTYTFWKEVRVRLKGIWVEPSYYVTQILSGHGNFKEKLKSFGLVEEDKCKCGRKETTQHILEECDRWKEERAEFLKEKSSIHKYLISKEWFTNLVNFANKVMLKKEEEDLLEEDREDSD